MFLEVCREPLEAGRFMTELALGMDVAGVPVVRREQGAIEKENAFVGHQVFILVMMS
jgi:hypothetical protein